MSGAPILGEIHQKFPILTVRCRRTCDWSFEGDKATERSFYSVYVDRYDPRGRSTLESRK
jgi:hypothetical protein